MARAGLRGCGVNTATARPGETFEVTFHVFDDAMPAATASYTKTITVVDPCSAGETYCPGSDLKCDGTPCALRARLEADGELQPVAPPQLLVLQPSGSYQPQATLHIDAVCGEALPFALSPCASGDASDACDVVAAVDASYVAAPEVVQHVHVGPCDVSSLRDASSAACVACSVPDLQAGVCEPSVQHVVTHLSDPSGASATLNVTLHVHERRAEAHGSLEVRAEGQQGGDGLAAALQRALSGALRSAAASAAACGDVAASAAFGVALAGVRTTRELAGASSGGNAERTWSVRSAATLSIGAQADSGAPAQAPFVLCLDAVLADVPRLQRALEQADAQRGWSFGALELRGFGNATVSRCPVRSFEERVELWIDAATLQVLTDTTQLALALVRRSRGILFFFSNKLCVLFGRVSSLCTWRRQRSWRPFLEQSHARAAARMAIPFGFTFF